MYIINVKTELQYVNYYWLLKKALIIHEENTKEMNV